MARTSGGSYACLLCGVTVRLHVKRHFLSRHADLGVVFVCPGPGCRRGFDVRRNIEQHIAKHHPQLRGIELDMCAVQKTS